MSDEQRSSKAQPSECDGDCPPTFHKLTCPDAYPRPGSAPTYTQEQYDGMREERDIAWAEANRLRTSAASAVPSFDPVDCEHDFESNVKSQACLACIHEYVSASAPNKGIAVHPSHMPTIVDLLETERDDLRGMLARMVEAHDGSHNESCDAFGHGEDAEQMAQAEEGDADYCDCGGIKLRQEARALLGPATPCASAPADVYACAICGRTSEAPMRTGADDGSTYYCVVDDAQVWLCGHAECENAPKEKPRPGEDQRSCRFCDKPVDWFTDGLPEDACLRCAALRRERTAAVNTAHGRGRHEGLQSAAEIVDTFMGELTGAMDRGIAYAIGVKIRGAAYDAIQRRERVSPAEIARMGQELAGPKAGAAIDSTPTPFAPNGEACALCGADGDCDVVPRGLHRGRVACHDVKACIARQGAARRESRTVRFTMGHVEHCLSLREAYAARARINAAIDAVENATDSVSPATKENSK